MVGNDIWIANEVPSFLRVQILDDVTFFQINLSFHTLEILSRKSRANNIIAFLCENMDFCIV